jgi:hypothetical protein
MTQLLLVSNGFPVGIGRILQSTAYDGRGSYYVETPDHLWSLMFERMQSQVAIRAAALVAWESQFLGPGHRATSEYWDSYQKEKAKHRVDYPMPWDHSVFNAQSEGK